MQLSQFATMNMVYQRFSFDYFLDSTQRLGIDKFELWAGIPEINNLYPTLAEVAKIRRQVESRKLKMVCLTPEQVMYPCNIAAKHGGLRQASMDYFLRYIDITAELGIDKMLCCAGWGDYDEPVEEAWKRSVDNLWRMTEHAAKAGVLLAFEILQEPESNLVNDLATTKRMMAAVDHPHFRLCVDTVPLRVRGNNLGEFFDAFGERIIHLHLTDGTPSGHIPCGLGETPVREHLDYMDRYGYAGDVTLEIGDGGWWHKPEEATRIAFDTVKQYI